MRHSRISTFAQQPEKWLALLTFFLLVSGVRADSRPRTLIEEVPGHGQTEADAEQDAVNQAREWIVGLLKERRPSLRWEPSAAYLREVGIVQRLTNDSVYKSDRLGPLHRVTLRVQLGEQDLRKMLQQDRLYQRHLLSAKVLAGLVALLLVLAVYLRLEETTRGYYTTPLRAGLWLCLGGISVGMWLLWYT